MMYYKKIANIIIKLFFNAIGFFLLLIGVVGVIMPIIPGIPFLAAAGFVFYKIDVNSKISINITKYLDRVKSNRFLEKLKIRFEDIREKI
jgi:uncharacterized membrane protein YbaN (DUF454 family)